MPIAATVERVIKLKIHPASRDANQVLTGAPEPEASGTLSIGAGAVAVLIACDPAPKDPVRFPKMPTGLVAGGDHVERSETSLRNFSRVFRARRLQPDWPTPVARQKPGSGMRQCTLWRVWN